MIRDTSESYKAYIIAYVTRLKEKRKTKAVEKLGGQCAKCGSSKDLHFDHIDPGTKVKAISGLWRASDAKFWAEVDKCQLLCNDCHKVKSKLEAQARAVLVHGTLNAYKTHKCRCEHCRLSVSEYKRAWRRRRLQSGEEVMKLKQKSKPVKAGKESEGR